MEIIHGLTPAAIQRARISRCPSPRCKRSNVRFYETAAAAAAAGYRPCLRCRPEVAPGSATWLGSSAVVRRALRLIQEGALDECSVEAFAARLGIGSRHLDRLFAEHVGVSPTAIAQTRRLNFAKQLLDETRLPITQIAMAAGFKGLRRFNELFRTTYGCAPRELRRKDLSGQIQAGGESIELVLSYRPPYDWERVAEFLALRAIQGVERVAEGGYTRTLRQDRGHSVIRVARHANRNLLRMSVIGARPAALLGMATAARRVFDLLADPARVADALSKDSLLRPLVEKRPGLRIPGVWDPFECAVRALLDQQIDVHAHRRELQLLVERIGDRIKPGVIGLTHLFPSPLATASAALSELGLPKSRAAALRALARACHEGRIDFGASHDEVMRALLALPGFSESAAQYVALRALGEPDAFPWADRALEDRSEAWRPWRGYAAVHLWEAGLEARRSAA
jgi:AraC family transcriptional regulator, regulatory protein of adaptative response / DNA-3-methyladenine glycosylase II